MSQPVPPQQPPPDGNPYAQPGMTGGNPYAQQPGAPVGGAGYPPPPGGPQPGAPYPAFPPGSQPPTAFAPPAVSAGNAALGLVAAVVAALVAASVYGVIIGLTKHEIGWAAIGVGALVGFAAGRVGGRGTGLHLVGAVLALGAVYLGQMVGEAMIGAKQLGTSFSELMFHHFGLVHDAWKSDSDVMTYLFFALAAFAAFSSAKKAAER